MTTPFSIQFPGLPAQPFANLGASNPVLSLGSQKACELKFTANVAGMEDDALAAEGQICTVICGGVPFFAGKLYRLPRQGSASSEVIDYRVLDAWNDFERIVYQQQWNIINGVDENGNPTTAAQDTSNCILGMALDGTQMNSGQVIADAVTWAFNHGAYCRIGNIGVSAPVPFDEITDLPVSEIIRKMLRWTPDAVTWFDYTQTPPAFNVTRRGACMALDMPFAGAAEKQDIESMPDLVPPCVVIRYLKVDTSNDGPSETTITPDICPENADPAAYGAMVMTCRLAGAQSTYQRQKVTTVTIPWKDSANAEGGPSSDPTIQWWQRKVPWLQNFGDSSLNTGDVADQLVITNVWGVYEVGQGDDDGSGMIEVEKAQYPNELLSGAVTDWMGVKWAKSDWSALVKYSYPASTADYSTQDWEATEIFGPDDGSGFSPKLKVTAKAVATNASTQTYSQMTGYTSAEPMPTGLAQQMYDAVSALQYKGSYTVAAQESPRARLGTVLNLMGGRGEWAMMNALVQEIEQDLETGATTFKFGPYGHLTLQDLMERIRSNRTRAQSSHINERKTGKAGAGSPIDGPEQGPADGGGSPPNFGLDYPWIGQEIDGVAGDSFANDLGGGRAGSGPPAPLKGFEIDVGNTGDGFSDGEYDPTSYYNAFSLISGDDAQDNDQLLFGRTDSSGAGGSVIITPYDDSGSGGAGPSMVFSPNLDGSAGAGESKILATLNGDDGSGDDCSQIDVLGHGDSPGEVNIFGTESQGEVDVTGNGASSSEVDITAGSDQSEIDMYGPDGAGSTEIDLTADASTAVVTLKGSDGATISIDTSDIAGRDASFRSVTFTDCSGGTTTAYILMTAPV